MDESLSVDGFCEDDLAISHRLIDWYQKNKRALPWRETIDPYIIWISEIILQQTRVAQGMDYYLRFTERFPNVKSLAAAEEDEVLKYWQGLGYYSRARNLQAAAKDIMKRFNGHFPVSYADILSLKGIGEYTAAAITSSAWNLPYAVLDGNVFRVLSRLFALDIPIDTLKGKKEFTRLATAIMNPAKSRLHNQAIMEFGALQCIPKNPDCLSCPLVDKCLAYRRGEVQSYPVKKNKIKTRDRFFHYFHIQYKGDTWLHRRGGKDIWTGLYEFPLIETATAMDFAELEHTEDFRCLFQRAGYISVDMKPQIRHVLSHQVLYANFYRIEIEKEIEGLNSYLRISSAEIEQYAVPRLIHLYLENL